MPLTNLARKLRHTQTDAEKRLWRALRARQLLGVKFRRQQPIERYIVDFCCLEKQLIIELDGSQHVAGREQDARRTADLHRAGFRVIRFWDNEVFQNLNGVLEVIRRALLASPSLPPSPVQGEGDGISSPLVGED